MAAVLSVTTVRAHDGKADETIAVMVRVKGHLNRLGAKARVVQQAFGPNPMTVSVIAEVADWNAFGAFSAAAAADAALQGELATIRANPGSTIIQRSVAIEI